VYLIRVSPYSRLSLRTNSEFYWLAILGSRSKGLYIATSPEDPSSLLKEARRPFKKQFSVFVNISYSLSKQLVPLFTRHQYLSTSLLASSSEIKKNYEEIAWVYRKEFKTFFDKLCGSYIDKIRIDSRKLFEVF